MSEAPVVANFGCRLNAVETEAMRGLALRAGLAGAVIVNTCAVTAEAVRQGRQQIRKLRRAHPGARLVVTGCAAETAPGDFAGMPEVDHVLGNARKLDAAAWAALAAGDGSAPRVLAGDFAAAGAFTIPAVDRFTARARAHVQVQTGCDHRCTFCIIPFGRGPSRSVPVDTVVAQVARLVANGYREVVLSGVDLTAWGADLAGAPRLGTLVQAVLAGVPDLPRLRLSSIDGIEADPALIEAILGEARVMPHLHLSLQAGDDLILKRMKRRHLRADAIRFCADLRARRPEIVFGADLIAGFPTETEAMFARTLDLVAECGLTWLHVFPYSPRPGTPAARMPQVAPAEARERAARLRALGAGRVAAHLAGEVGSERRILVEKPRLGRTEGFAEVAFDSDRPVGEIVAARIRGTDGVRLLAASTGSASPMPR